MLPSEDKTRKFSRSGLSSAKSGKSGYSIKSELDKGKGNGPLSIFHKDDDDHIKLPKPTSKEVSDLIHGREAKEEAMNTLRNSFKRFNSLHENSPLEAPVAGFNRHLRYMSPITRDMVLKSRMPDIMAFAEDRKLDPGIIAGVAEASMRLGRIPDLGSYGLSGDDALAVKDFIKDNVLNLAEELDLDNTPVQEDGDSSPKGRHLKLAGDYNKLAEFHKRRAKEEMDKAKISKESGRAHSAIKANAASEEHQTLADHCMGLADYHQLRANEHPAIDSPKTPEYPAQDPKKLPAEPPQDKNTEKKPNTSGPKDAEPKTESSFSRAASRFETIREDDAEQPITKKPGLLSKVGSGLKKATVGAADTVGKAAGSLITNTAAAAGAGLGSGLGNMTNVVPAAAAGLRGQLYTPKVAATEATIEGSIAQSVLNPIGVRKTTAFPERANSIVPNIPPVVEVKACKNKYTRWGGEKDMLNGKKLSAQNYDTESPSDDAERPLDKKFPMESTRTFGQGQLLEDILVEAKKHKATAKKKQKSEKVKGVLANAKVAPMFHALGHKMDHAETKITGDTFKPKWAKELYQKCLKAGGSGASDIVIQHSINNPWVREMGFTDEASNLRRNWETAMSDDAHRHASDNSPTAPEPVVFAINKMIKMSSK